MLDNAIPQGFEDAVELRRKNRETVVKYMNTKGQDRLRRHELFVEDGCGRKGSQSASSSSNSTTSNASFPSPTTKVNFRSL